MRLVIIESPYAGDVERNLRYARACLADSLARGESPLASHLLFTQPGVLDDTKPEERKRGIAAGFAWRGVADATVFYTDLGMSDGMAMALQDTLELPHRSDRDHDVETRRLGGEWCQPFTSVPPGVDYQPSPSTGDVEVWPLVLADIDARQAFGLAKYGVPLRTNDGRKSLIDAYQEALDLVVYLRKEIEERRS